MYYVMGVGMSKSRKAEILFNKIKREGISSAFNKTAITVSSTYKARFFEAKNPDGITFVDVLFINGCDYSVPHPIRYRVDHQIQQLESCGISTLRIDASQLEMSMAVKARSFIFFRCPFTEKIGAFIDFAKMLNKSIYYDIDDLVIDTKYTNTIPYIRSMNPVERKNYDDGVFRMGKMLKKCGVVITSTTGMAHELIKYVPKVFVNRNVVSEEMLYCSDRAIYERDVLPELAESQVEPRDHHYWRWAKKNKEIRKAYGLNIGYFSGSITHNSDFDIVLPALLKIMKERKNVGLTLVGDLDIPEVLQPFKDRIHFADFCDWHDLPRLIASVDINIAPLVDSVFNRAKSENKWIEAAIVKVPTVASDVGAFHEMIKQNVTGVLCNNTTKAWYAVLTDLLDNSDKRISIGETANDWCRKNCTTLYGTGLPLVKFLHENQKRNVFFALPSLKISGGVLVAMKHACILQDSGIDVALVDCAFACNKPYIIYENHTLPVLKLESKRNKQKDPLFRGCVDIGVATLWDTVYAWQRYFNVKKIFYLVQNYETDFYSPSNPLRLPADNTYCLDKVEYLTISRWCENWLKDRFHKKARFAPNGIKIDSFKVVDRDFSGKIRILVEGDNASNYKNVDESFRIIDRLDPSKYEIWYMSYNAAPKSTYRVDKFLHAVPHEKVHEVYEQCHILIKTSILESFSYPPLEMMATGGFVVVVPNDGNTEFIRNEENCLTYQQGDIDKAVLCIKKIVDDPQLREKLKINGRLTAEQRDWKNIESSIIKLYTMN